MSLEVCVDSIEAVNEAARGGADRLELCSALSEGGLTPSIGLLKRLKQQHTIPVFVLVRPRCGDFVYTANEHAVMIEDIKALKAAGADGFVFGCLTRDGDVDTVQCAELLGAAAPLPCTFHRAFDHARCPEIALETIVALGGFQRLLTSGQAPTAVQGAGVIARLVGMNTSLTIMPGGGITVENAANLTRVTGARELHASARTVRSSARPPPAGVSMGARSDETSWMQCDHRAVAAIKSALKSVSSEDTT